jgi:hypothetical protein
LQRKEHIGAEDQQDRQQRWSILVARDSNHTSAHLFRLRVQTAAREATALSTGQLTNALNASEIESTLKEIEMICAGASNQAHGRQTWLIR